MNDGNYREFADCFVTYEEREDGNGIRSSTCAIFQAVEENCGCMIA
ncbi:MAG: hypothetical protein ACLTC4_17645 [Hungatella hathewayi]|nr:hypothetical protein [Hungatella hathewayi]